MTGRQHTPDSLRESHVRVALMGTQLNGYLALQGNMHLRAACRHDSQNCWPEKDKVAAGLRTCFAGADRDNKSLCTSMLFPRAPPAFAASAPSFAASAPSFAASAPIVIVIFNICTSISLSLSLYIYIHTCIYVYMATAQAILSSSLTG